MAGKLVDVIHKTDATYEIREQPSRRTVKFAIYRDGVAWRGEYTSLRAAIDAALKAPGK